MPSVKQLRGALTAWIVAPHHAENVRVSSEPNGMWQIAAVLYELWDDEYPLPPDIIADLRLLPTSTYSHLARLLWSLCSDDTGPCHSHRAVLDHLRGLGDPVCDNLAVDLDLREPATRLSPPSVWIGRPAAST